MTLDDGLNEDVGIVLHRDYVSAFTWLKSIANHRRVVVLASPNTSLWLPVWSGANVVYGHPTVTNQATFKWQAVIKWYQIETINQCDTRLLRGDYSFRANRYAVNYVILGPQELNFGRGICTTLLRPVARFGTVSIYMYQAP